MIKVSENQMPWDDIPEGLVHLNAINKVKYILNKYGYRVDKILNNLNPSAKKDFTYYRKGFVQDNTLRCVTIRHGVCKDSDGKIHEQTIISFDNCVIHSTEYTKAYYVIDEIYKETGDYINLYFNGLCFDDEYRQIIDEIDARLYKLKKTWR